MNGFNLEYFLLLGDTEKVISVYSQNVCPSKMTLNIFTYDLSVNTYIRILFLYVMTLFTYYTQRDLLSLSNLLASDFIAQVWCHKISVSEWTPLVSLSSFYTF